MPVRFRSIPVRFACFTKRLFRWISVAAAVLVVLACNSIARLTSLALAALRDFARKRGTREAGESNPIGRSQPQSRISTPRELSLLWPPRAMCSRGAAIALALATTLLCADVAHACSRCGFAVCRHQVAPQYHTAAPYVAPVVTPSYDYVDHRFQVTYNITFPPPAISGATAYAYTPPTLSLLDPALYLNSASRYLELSQQTSQSAFQQFSQTSQTILQGQQGIEELRARERLLERAAQLVAATQASGSATQASGSRLQATAEVEPPPGAPMLKPEAWSLKPASVDAIVAAKCVRCHGPDRQNGGLRLDNLATLDRRFENKIIAKILADEPAERMPPPGADKLSIAEKLTFLRASGICGKKE